MKISSPNRALWMSMSSRTSCSEAAITKGTRIRPYLVAFRLRLLRSFSSVCIMRASAIHTPTGSLEVVPGRFGQSAFISMRTPASSMTRGARVCVALGVFGASASLSRLSPIRARFGPRLWRIGVDGQRSHTGGRQTRNQETRFSLIASWSPFSHESCRACVSSCPTYLASIRRASCCSL